MMHDSSDDLILADGACLCPIAPVLLQMFLFGVANKPNQELWTRFSMIWFTICAQSWSFTSLSSSWVQSFIICYVVHFWAYSCGSELHLPEHSVPMFAG